MLFSVRKKRVDTKIKKVDSKPMNIRKKTETKIHIKKNGKWEDTVKGYTIRQRPTIMPLKNHKNKVWRNNQRKTVHTPTNNKQKEAAKKLVKEEVKDKLSMQSHMPDKKQSAAYLHSVILAGGKTASEQMEGGEEIRDSMTVLYTVANPITNTIKKGTENLNKEKQAAALEERKARLKIAGSQQKKEGNDKGVVRGKIEKGIAVNRFLKRMRKSEQRSHDSKGSVIPKVIGSHLSAQISKKETRTNSSLSKTRAYGIAQAKRKDKRKKYQKKMVAVKKKAAVKQTGIAIKQILAHMATPLLLFLSLIAVVLLPVIVIIVILYNSPFALFLPSLQEGETLMHVASAYQTEFKQELKTLAEAHTGCDEGEIVYGDYEGDGRADNYYDILAVYMVKHGIGDTATVMNDTTKGWLKDIFDDMCSYSISTRSEAMEIEAGGVGEEDEDTNEESVKAGTETGAGVEISDGENEPTEPAGKTVLSINVELKTYRDMIAVYDFNEEEANLLTELMTSEYMAALGNNGGNGSSGGGGSGAFVDTLPPEEYQPVVDGIADKRAKQAVSFALSKLGYPYSQPLRDSGTHYDCSSFVYYAWLSAGVSLLYEGSNTAAQEAKWCSDHGYTVSYGEMKPGDLIFYSFGSNNGRYLNISHVALYCGNGKLVDASSSKGKVVYRDVYSAGSIVLIGRPQ